MSRWVHTVSHVMHVMSMSIFFCLAWQLDWLKLRQTAAVSDEKSRPRLEDIARGLDEKNRISLGERSCVAVRHSCLSNARSRSPWPCKWFSTGLGMLGITAQVKKWKNPSMKITVECINARVWSSIHFPYFRSDLMVTDSQWDAQICFSLGKTKGLIQSHSIIRYFSAAG